MTPSSRVLATVEIDATDADAAGFEPVKCDGRMVGYVTSGAYGHWVGRSLALAYVDREVVAAGPALTVDVIGEPRAARLLDAPAYDPQGLRMRS